METRPTIPGVRHVAYFGETIALPAFDDDERFYQRLTQGRWEVATFRALERFLDRDTTFIDVGAWIGAMAFWAARRARAVIAVEPDPVSFARLEAVARLNPPNVQLLAAALSDQPTVTLYAKKAFGRSSSSVVTGDPSQRVEVRGVSLSALLRICEGPVFLKIDIEGLEYRLREMIVEQAEPRIKGFQLAVHPHLYSRSLRGIGNSSRLHAFRESLRLFKEIPGFRLVRPAGAGAFCATAIFRILLRRKPAGWDVLYTQAA